MCVDTDNNERTCGKSLMSSKDGIDGCLWTFLIYLPNLHIGLGDKHPLPTGVKARKIILPPSWDMQEGNFYY